MTEKRNTNHQGNCGGALFCTVQPPSEFQTNSQNNLDVALQMSNLF